MKKHFKSRAQQNYVMAKLKKRQEKVGMPPKDRIVVKERGFHLKGGIPSILEAGVEYKTTTINQNEIKRQVK